MKRSKFGVAHMAFVLKQAEKGSAVGEVCCKAGLPNNFLIPRAHLPYGTLMRPGRMMRPI